MSCGSNRSWCAALVAALSILSAPGVAAKDCDYERAAPPDGNASFCDGVFRFSGPAEFTLAVDDVELSDRDCAVTCEQIGSPSYCSGKCIFGPIEFLKYDAGRQRLFLTARLGSAHNDDYPFFLVDLTTGTVTRIGTDFGTVMDGAAVSPSGRLLAYRLYSKYGDRCGGYSYVRILDIERRGQLQTPGVKARPMTDTETRTSDSFVWLDDERMEVKRSYRACDGSEAPPSVTEIWDLSAAPFAPY